MPGSPPRMRGKASRGGLILKDDGITPAYAGKSIQTFQFVQYHRDHPRVCGEKLSISSAHISQTGSPPRMRGKARMILIHVNGERITPAYAGKRVRPCLTCFAHRDHPRVCGEKQSGCVPCSARFRITPAYAGKSQCRASLAHLHGDHPRVCGEKAQTAQQTETRKGSPPRMRGKGVQPRDKRVAVRITPAYAGKSPKSRPATGPERDHPRVCGEKPRAGA